MDSIFATRAWTQRVCRNREMGTRVRSTLLEGKHQLLPRGLPEPGDVSFHRRNGGLTRCCSLRDSWKRRLLALPPQKREAARRQSLKRSPLKRQSKGLKAEQAKYRKLAAVFLARPENAWCLCCTLRRERLGENILRNQSVEIHHWAGRIGRLLCYVPYFRAFCNACRTFPHEHPSLARELNLLAPAHLWNHYPSDRN